ncbi:MAG: xanthan lyase, partial [Verrucomicrobiota bacterium]
MARFIDQSRDDRTWVCLGTFHFEAGTDATVTLTNESSDSGVVIADTIRIGAGVGSISRGSGTSGQARWRECSRYWAEFSGAPSTVWDASTGSQDNNDDVTCRPRFAEWRGADAYLSVHTNAGGGFGT